MKMRVMKYRWEGGCSVNKKNNNKAAASGLIIYKLCHWSYKRNGYMWLCFLIAICMLKDQTSCQKTKQMEQVNQIEIWDEQWRAWTLLLLGNTYRHYTERLFLHTTQGCQHSPANSASKCLGSQLNFSTTETELTGLEPTVMPRNTWTRTLSHWGKAVWREESCSRMSILRLCLHH